MQQQRHRRRSGAVTQLDEIQRKLQDEDLVNWNKAFHNYADISAWLDRLASAHPALVQVVVVGKTYEGVDIKGVKISAPPPGSPPTSLSSPPLTAAPSATPKPALFMDGCVHAREWISAAVVQYLITR